ncbi:MAG TPA: hypothetical protein PK299_13760 [Anaerolineales bacterium]|nr:hypothetical protein [Anaerolineales bacterium]
MTEEFARQDRFAGSWLVTEYVYQFDGQLAGLIEQERSVYPLPNGTFQVVQVCKPALPSAHPLSAFRGGWLFALEKQGAYRYYLGPDVKGFGREWADGFMLGQGVWPRLGFNFTSYAFRISPTRQLTGGVFHNAGIVVAEIIGIGVLQSDENTPYPRIQTETVSPALISNRWVGSATRFFADGSVKEQFTVQRELYDSVGWCDTFSDGNILDVKITPRQFALDVNGSFAGDEIYGKARYINGSFRADLVLSNGWNLQLFEVLDVQSNQLLTYRNGYYLGVHQYLDLIYFSPNPV